MRYCNDELPTHPGLIVNDSYWCWPERNLAGNAIDLFVQVFGMSFHDAMRATTGSCPSVHRPPASPAYDANEVEIREQSKLPRYDAKL